MSANGNGAEFKKRLEKKTDFHFIEHWEEGKKPFNWFAEWRPLSVCIYEIEIVDRFIACDHEISFGDDLAKTKQPGEDKDLSDEERAKFIDFLGDDPTLFGDETKEEIEKRRAGQKQRAKVFNKRFRIVDNPHDRYLRGKCSLEDDRSINLIEDGEEPPNWGKFGKGNITIHSAKDQHLGSVGINDESDIKWDRTGETQVGDLWFEFYMPQEIFDGLVERFQQIGSAAVCYAHMSALMFQGEVERSLAEPYHSQTYFLEIEKYSTMGKVVLESVSVVTPKPVGSEPTSGYRDHVGVDDFDVSEEEDWLDEKPAAKQAQQPAQIPSQPQKPIRLWPVTLALWAVFFGLVLNAISR